VVVIAVSVSISVVITIGDAVPVADKNIVIVVKE
jgi:hypothetical protein